MGLEIQVTQKRTTLPNQSNNFFYCFIHTFRFDNLKKVAYYPINVGYIPLIIDGNTVVEVHGKNTAFIYSHFSWK